MSLVSPQGRLTVMVQPVEKRNLAFRPSPLEVGFEDDVLYQVIVIQNTSESAESYFGLCNRKGELWWLSSRDFRVVSYEI